MTKAEANTLLGLLTLHETIVAGHRKRREICDPGLAVFLFI